jgi:hypothetical protein
MTLEMWQRGLGIKTTGTWNLWESLASRSHDMTLDFFVILSSMISVIGNQGQTNYAAGNAYQDAMARHLTAEGHNVISLNLPLMSDVGSIAAKPTLRKYLFDIGWHHMTGSELLFALDYYCRPNKLDPAHAQCLPRIWLPRYTAAEGAIQPAWQHEPKFNHLVLHNYEIGSSSKQVAGQGTISTRLSMAGTRVETETIVLEALLEKLSRILSVEAADLDSASPMHAYGVDSLVAVELRTWMKKDIGSDISVFEITGGQSIKQMASKAAGGSRFIQVKADV